MFQVDVTPRLDLRFVPDAQHYPVMPDNSVKPIAKMLALRHVAAHHLLGAVDVGLLGDSEGRTMPAKVYPASEDAEAWVVEPPVDDVSAMVEPKTFTGRAALLQAVQYAHDTYGCARFLSR